jgi:outer membrane lipoprotein-sorting protein
MNTIKKDRLNLSFFGGIFMKQKKVIILSAILLIIVSIFLTINYNYFKFGNIINRSADQIKDYILNINSFEAEVQVTVKTNKTTNTYKLSQKYLDGRYKQTLLEPTNIAGLEIEYENGSMKVVNTKLNLSQIYENYPCVAENYLWLNSFIEDFKNSNETKIIEEDNEVILQSVVKNGNKYTAVKRLYIDKKRGKPIKIEVQDVEQNILVYILYNEITINKLQEV